MQEKHLKIKCKNQGYLHNNKTTDLNLSKPKCEMKIATLFNTHTFSPAIS